MTDLEARYNAVVIESLGLPPLPLPTGWLAPGETSPVLLPVGFLLLFFGRRLFWLLVALVGALAALWLATEMLGLEAGAPSLVAAVAAGLAGGLLAVLVQKAAIGVVGFLVGLWGTLALLEGLARTGALAIPDAAAVWIAPSGAQLVLAIAGGVLGAVLAARLFAAALVVLSALAGSLLLVHGLGLDGSLALAAFLGLALVGVLVQTRAGGGRRRRPETEDD